jgi:hypothetical protein
LNIIIKKKVFDLTKINLGTHFKYFNFNFGIEGNCENQIIVKNFNNLDLKSLFMAIIAIEINILFPINFLENNHSFQEIILFNSFILIITLFKVLLN